MGSVLVEEDGTTFVMGHVEAIRQKARGNVVRHLQEVKNMPFPHNLILESIFFSPSGSRVPVVDAESPLHNQTGCRVLIETVIVKRCSRFPS